MSFILTLQNVQISFQNFNEKPSKIENHKFTAHKLYIDICDLYALCFERIEAIFSSRKDLASNLPHQSWKECVLQKIQLISLK